MSETLPQLKDFMTNRHQGRRLRTVVFPLILEPNRLQGFPDRADCRYRPKPVCIFVAV